MGIKCPKCQSDNPETATFCADCGTKITSAKDIGVTKTIETPAEEFTRGTYFADRYEIIEVLGKGGMGRVYKALDTEIREEVAIKLLKPEIATDESIIERFRNELKFARKIGHKNVCKMYHLAIEKETPYITMEYVPGEDLKSFVRRKGKLADEEAISIAKQVCKGLSAAHELGVVHRDLKPQNIMIDEAGNAKVMDFGIARSIEAAGVTQTGVMIGTPDYISPEQADGEEADQRSDIYSLGVVLYEMVTGQLPFKGDTAFSVALKHKSKIPLDPRKLNPEISEDLDRLILICIEKDRERRYKTADLLFDDLVNIEEGLPLGTKIKPRRDTFASALIRKKFFIPASVLVLVIVALLIWQVLPSRQTGPTPSGKPSIAVLPFKDLSPEKDQGHLCEGIAGSLITALSHLQDLRVPASTSSFSFQNKEQVIQEIGEKLSVKTLLMGKLQKSGSRLRINIELINVADESLLWSEQYSREMDDVFAIQDEISLAVVDKLKLDLMGEERAKLVKRYTENPEAYDAYTQGLYFMNKRTVEGIRKGMPYFKQAIEKDTSYALAYVGLADSYILSSYYGILPPKDAIPKAKTLTEKALEIDDTLAEAHTSLAFANTIYYWNWPSAGRGFKKAIELNPAYALAHHWHAAYLAARGRFDEAIAEIKRAVELDPLDIRLQTELGNFLNWSGRSDEAIEQLHKVLEMNPNFGIAHLWLGHTYEIKEMYKEAIAAFQKAIELGIPLAFGPLGAVYAKSGDIDEAREILSKLVEQSKQGYVLKHQVVLVYMGLGDIDKAFEWLERAYDERDSGMYLIKSWPGIGEKLRSDPRFTAILKKMGLE